MDWHEARLSLQVSAEVQAGVAMRTAQRLVKAREDAAWNAVVAGSSRGNR